MLVSLFFVVATMIEFAIVLLVKRNSRSIELFKNKKKISADESLFTKERCVSQLMKNISPFPRKESKATIRSSNERKRLNLQNQKEDIEGMKTDIGLSAHVVIDLIASCLFPISYVIFNIIYWYMVL